MRDSLRFSAAIALALILVSCEAVGQKQVYLKGEPVTLAMNASEMQLVHGNDIYFLNGSSQIFLPPFSGKYDVLAFQNGTAVANDSFLVLDRSFSIERQSYHKGEAVSISTPSGSDIYILFGSERHHYSDVANGLVFIPRQPGAYSVEAYYNAVYLGTKQFDVTDTGPVAKASVKPSQSFFRKDERPKAEFQLKQRKLLGIFSTGLASDTVSVELRNSRGERQQADINATISGDNLEVSLDPGPEMAPGLYTLSATSYPDNEIYSDKFYWGVLSVNTQKSSYKPGETAQIILVVLDENGYGVENAQIELSVQSPSSVTEPQIIAGSEPGIYLADYQTNEAGNYTIAASSWLGGNQINFTTSFIVDPNPAFQIIRFAKSKIDPTRQEWEQVKVSIIPRSGEAFVAQESVPSFFELITDASVSEANGKKVMSWNSTTLTYSYKVPAAWPRLYTLGPIMIAQSGTAYAEPRPWYVAVDPSHLPASFLLTNGTKIVDGDISNLTLADNSSLILLSYALNFSSNKSTATAAYKSNTLVNTIQSPKVRTWDGNAWSAESELATAGSNLAHMRIVNSPQKYRYWEKILVTASSDGYLDAYVWDGSAWQVSNDIGYVGPNAASTRPFDIAYEKTRGNALLVYGITSISTVQDLAFKEWNGSAWSAEEYIDAAGFTSDLQAAYVELATKPTAGSNEIGLLYSTTGSLAMSEIWNGSEWTNEHNMTATLSSATMEPLALNYEQVSGDLVLVVGNTSAGTARMAKWEVWNGASYSASGIFDINTAANQAIYWLSLKSDPASDRMVITCLDAGTDMSTGRWDGSGWTSDGRWDGTVDQVTSRVVDFMWAPTASKGVLIWGTALGSLSYRNYTAPATWSATEGTFTAGANIHPWIRLDGNPRSITNDVDGFGMDLEATVNDLDSLTMNGTTPRIVGSAFTANTLEAVNESFDLDSTSLVTPTSLTSTLRYWEPATFMAMTSLTGVQQWAGLLAQLA